MVEQEREPRTSGDEAVLQQQYLRALSSFEGIVLSQIDVKNKLGDRLNYAIRSGLIILFVIAFSILVLLLTLSSQVNRISNVVGSMNTHFAAITLRMDEISADMESIEVEVAKLPPIGDYTAQMQGDVSAISGSMSELESRMTNTSQHMQGSRISVEHVAATISVMNQEVQAMSMEMHRMAKPARNLNRMFPFP